MQYAWIAILILAVVVEALTSDFVAIWFFPAALVALVVSFFDVPIAVQILIFLLVGTVLVFATRPLCRKLTAQRGERTNADALIGKSCVVTEEVNNLRESGEVRVGGLCWSARAEDNETVIPVGTTVTVLEIHGVKLIVK